MMSTYLFILIGFLLLVVGGEFLVRGAVNVASRLGVSPLVIGLTLVGFGTSTPELVTSVQAALAGSPGIAFGNIVGSNIANILLILGASAIVFPIAVSSAALRRDGAIMVLVAVAFAGLAALLPMGRGLGLVFVLALALYIFMAFRQESTARPADHGAAFDKGLALQQADPALAPSEKSLVSQLLLSLTGLLLVVGGGYLLVTGAVALARSLEISETVIGLTVVAVGTSLPELVTSVVASVKRQSDVAFGNIVGSNIYNILGIGGVTAIIQPSEVPAEIVSFDNLVMVGVSILLIIVATSGARIVRGEGALMLGGYGAYVYALWPA